METNELKTLIKRTNRLYSRYYNAEHWMYGVNNDKAGILKFSNIDMYTHYTLKIAHIDLINLLIAPKIILTRKQKPNKILIARKLVKLVTAIIARLFYEYGKNTPSINSIENEIYTLINNSLLSDNIVYINKQYMDKLNNVFDNITDSNDIEVYVRMLFTMIRSLEIKLPTKESNIKVFLDLINKG